MLKHDVCEIEEKEHENRRAQCNTIAKNSTLFQTSKYNINIVFHFMETVERKVVLTISFHFHFFTAEKKEKDFFFKSHIP